MMSVAFQCVSKPEISQHALSLEIQVKLAQIPAPCRKATYSSCLHQDLGGGGGCSAGSCFPGHLLSLCHLVGGSPARPHTQVFLTPPSTPSFDLTTHLTDFLWSLQSQWPLSSLCPLVPPDSILSSILQRNISSPVHSPPRPPFAKDH